MDNIDHTFDKFPNVLDASTLEKAARCLRKVYWSNIRNKADPATNPHLNAGGAYAMALFTFRKLYFEECKTFVEARALAVIELTKAYGTYDPPKDKSHKAWINVVYAFIFYLEYYPPSSDAIKPYKINDKACLEFSFAIPLPINHPDTGQPLLYGGRSDMLGEDPTGVVYVEDDKTTGAMGPKWHEQWLMRGQFTGYIWAAKIYGYPVNGGIIRGVSIQKTQNKHLQMPIFRSQWEIDRWYETMLDTVQMMVDAYKAKKWPANGAVNNVCTMYGTCPYMTLCRTREPEKAMGNYIDYHWSPVKEANEDV